MKCVVKLANRSQIAVIGAQQEAKKYSFFFFFTYIDMFKIFAFFKIYVKYDD